jgi:hypothetical protein
MHGKFEHYHMCGDDIAKGDVEQDAAYGKCLVVSLNSIAIRYID